MDEDGRPQSRRLNVVLAEGDADLRSLLAIVLRSEGHRVLEVRDGAELGLKLANDLSFGADAGSADLLLIVDLRLPGTDTFALLRQLRLRNRMPRFIALVASANQEMWQEASALGALAFFEKPFDFDDLRSAVSYLAAAPRAS
jgi:two-component system, response regulator, stage 0 sporulation protein F